MRVINVSFDDYANFSYDNAMALKSVGVDANSYKIVKHPFGYKNESDVVSRQRMRLIIKQADLVQIFHSANVFIQDCLDAKKPFVVYHTGTSYRSNPEGMNHLFNRTALFSLTDQCEFINLGAKNLHYIAGAIDAVKYPKFNHQIKTPFKIAHYPSNAEVKGTDKIIEMMLKVKSTNFVFDWSKERVTHAEQFKRMGACDVYIELFNKKLNGKPYGCYGITAFEAAAMGKVVITQNINPKVYEDVYGRTQLLYCNTEKEFIKQIEILGDMSMEQISTLQTYTYNWVLEKHSYQATGNYLKKLFSLYL